MPESNKCLIIVAAFVALLLPAVPAIADWDEGDGHKMHYPQLPDPNGYDVAWGSMWLGDDWQCGETGPVNDIHLWLSFYGWNDPTTLPPGMATASLQVQIWGNKVDGGYGYSVPDGLRWQRTFYANPPVGTNDLLTARHYGTGEQGWYIPLENKIDPLGAHDEYFQINIENIIDPFVQTKDEIYWLVTKLNLPGTTAAGWKTSGSPHFMDDAVFYYDTEWWEISIAGESRDLAFVITPEPGTIALAAMAFAALGFWGRRRRK